MDHFQEAGAPIYYSPQYSIQYSHRRFRIKRPNTGGLMSRASDFPQDKCISAFDFLEGALKFKLECRLR